jgi:Zn-dependent protease with chaperone function
MALRFLFFSISALLCPITLFGQNAEYYKPIPADPPSIIAAEAKKIDKRYETYIKQMKSQYKGKLGVSMAAQLKEGKDYLKQNIQDGQFVFDHDIYRYVCSVFEKICNGNDINPGDYHILLRRSPELNAACYPDGTFILNIGLFYYLDNEHEFAAVIAHELAHKLLKHWERRSEYKFSMENDPKYQAELKQIKSQKNNRYDKAFDVFRGQLYANMNVRRSYEFEADSLGYLLLRKSPFKSQAVFHALDFMVQADSFEFLQISEETFRTIFSTPDLTFKDSWLTIEDMSAYDYSLYKEKLDKDSLSSHPETKERLDYLTRVFPDITESERLEADKEYTRYNEMSVMEIVPSLYQQKAYGSALHAALMLYESGENQYYHKAWIGFCLDKSVSYTHLTLPTKA